MRWPWPRWEMTGHTCMHPWQVNSAPPGTHLRRSILCIPKTSCNRSPASDMPARVEVQISSAGQQLHTPVCADSGWEGQGPALVMHAWHAAAQAQQTCFCPTHQVCQTQKLAWARRHEVKPAVRGESMLGGRVLVRSWSTALAANPLGPPCCLVAPRVTGAHSCQRHAVPTCAGTAKHPPRVLSAHPLLRSPRRSCLLVRSCSCSSSARPCPARCQR